MSDFSIPGVSGKYKTEKLIEDLMKVERIPLERMEESVESYKKEQKSWQFINRLLSQTQSKLRNLYGYDNPFQERLALSEDEIYFTATAERGATEEKFQIRVLQTAKKDKFLSAPIKQDYKVPSGNYVFRVGDKKIQFKYSGGSLRDFVDRLNNKGESWISARLVKDSPDTQVLVIESEKEGAANKLGFEEDARKLLVDLGMVRNEPVFDKQLDISAAQGVGETSKSSWEYKNGKLEIAPAAELSLALKEKIKLGKNHQLEIEYSIEQLAETPQKPRPQGPEYPESGGVELEGVKVEDFPPEALLSEIEVPKPPEKRKDMQVFFLQGDKEEALPQLSDAPGKQKMQISITDYVDDLKALNFRNRNTHHKVTVHSIRIMDTSSSDGFKPVNPASEAADARFELDGVSITRPSNTIDDVIPKVKLLLKEESSRELDLSIEPDREAIKNSLIEFVALYNRSMAELNILTRSEEAIVDDLNYLSDEEKDEAKERLGIFQGDSSLNHVKNQLKTLMMNPYIINKADERKTLASIGISTHASVNVGSPAASRLRGYMEIDEQVLDMAMAEDLIAVKNLFGYDSDGDFIADNGLGPSLNEYLKAYTQSGGIISTRIAGIDRRIDRKQDEIKDYNEHLKDYEQRLKEKYGKMEGMLEEMEKSSQAIENFNSRNQR